MKIKNYTNDYVGIVALDIPDTGYFGIEVVFPVGSLIEEDYERIFGKKIYGGLHMLEHICFKSPKGYTTDNLQKWSTENSVLNASTDFDFLNFYCNTTNDNKDKAIDATMNVAYNNLELVTKEEFELEKQVVIAEVKQYLEQPETVFYFNSVGLKYGNNVENNLIGSIEILENITLDDLKNLKFMITKFIFNQIIVSYDSKVCDIEHVVDTIYKLHNELGRGYDITTGKHLPKELKDYYYKFDTSNMIKPGEYKIETESKKANISITTDIDYDIPSAFLGNRYLNKVAGPGKSLYSVYREEHGLTYDATINATHCKFNKKYISFRTDADIERKEESIELYKSSIIKMAESFTEEDYNKTLKEVILKIAIDLNLSTKYDWVTHLELLDRSFYNTLVEDLDGDLSRLAEVFYSQYTSYEKVKHYFDELADAIKNNKIIIITDK